MYQKSGLRVSHHAALLFSAALMSQCAGAAVLVNSPFVEVIRRASTLTVRGAVPDGTASKNYAFGKSDVLTPNYADDRAGEVEGYTSQGLLRARASSAARHTSSLALIPESLLQLNVDGHRESHLMTTTAHTAGSSPFVGSTCDADLVFAVNGAPATYTLTGRISGTARVYLTPGDYDAGFGTMIRDVRTTALAPAEVAFSWTGTLQPGHYRLNANTSGTGTILNGAATSLDLSGNLTQIQFTVVPVPEPSGALVGLVTITAAAATRRRPAR
jgi:hypothetical protein